MQLLKPEERSAIILDYANKLKENIKPIMEANALDIKLAKENSKYDIKFLHKSKKF